MIGHLLDRVYLVLLSPDRLFDDQATIYVDARLRDRPDQPEAIFKSNGPSVTGV